MVYEEKPEGFDPKLHVVGCFVENARGEILFLQRNAAKSYGNTWGTPAGKVDGGESLAEAIKREVCEETGLDKPVEDFHFLKTGFVKDGGTRIVYHKFRLYLDEEPTVTLSPTEHTNYVWVTPQDALCLDLIHDEDVFIKMFYPLLETDVKGQAFARQWG